MIIIKRDIELNVLVLPSIPFGYSDVKMLLHSDFTNRDYTINLIDNVALHSQRYSEYEISSEAYVNIELGLYQYKIVADDEVLITGMCKVQEPINSSNYTSIPSIKNSVEDDDYLVFN